MREFAGEGERLAAQRARRTRIIILALAGAGFVTGLIVGVHAGRNDLDFSSSWPPSMALAVAVTYLIATIGGSLLLVNSLDEVERANNYKAAAFAAGVYVMVYPVWFVLWKGQFLPEPSHWMIFIAVWLSLMGSYLYYRLR